MKQEILTQIEALGGNIQQVKGESLEKDLAAIEFKQPLYSTNYASELYGISEFYQANKQLYSDNQQAFYKSLLDHFFSDKEIPYGQCFYRNWPFSPFKEGSYDFGELDGFVTEEELREVVAGQEMEFVCICYSYGFPDQYYVCLTDPNQENPTVYGSDHEECFEEITAEGTLEEFFNQFLTKDEFLKTVQNHLENKKAV